MSDLVTVALIAALQAVTIAVLNTRAKKTDSKMEVIEGHAAETKAAVAETNKAIVTLEKNTNSIKDELVKVTGLQQHAAGKLEGRAEIKAELQEGASEEESG